MKILIADDDRIYTKLVSQHLENWGYSPVVVFNGKEAWDMLQSPGGPSIAILDWDMPALSGIEISNKMYNEKSFKVFYSLIATSKHSKDDIIKALQSGADDYLVKPLDYSTLRLRLKIAEHNVVLRNYYLQKKSEEFHQNHLESLRNILGRGAHSISNPLGIILGSAELMQLSVKDDKQLDRIEVIKSSTTRISKIIESLIKFSNIGVAVEPEEFILIEAIDEVLNGIGPLNHIHFTLSLDTNLSISQNRNVFKEALLQIVQNAVEASVDSLEKKVEIIGVNGDGGVEISILDSGVAIDEEIKSSIFDPFFSTKNSLGMGLSIASGLIASIGGAVFLDKNLKQTCFKIFLPTELVVDNEKNISRPH